MDTHFQCVRFLRDLLTTFKTIYNFHNNFKDLLLFYFSLFLDYVWHVIAILF